MSIEAFWCVNFGNDVDSAGAGVVIFESGRIFGGDSSYYYKGDYSIKNGEMAARILVKRHNTFLPSIFGNINEFHLVVNRGHEGDFSGNKFMVSGYMEEDPEKVITAGFARLDELP